MIVKITQAEWFQKVSYSDHEIIAFSSQSKGHLLLQRLKDESSRSNLERDEVLFERKFLGHDTLEKHDTENRNPAVFLKLLSQGDNGHYFVLR